MTHTFDYCSNLVYEDSELSFLLTPGGRAIPTEQEHEYVYEYFLTDHLSNVRVVFGDPERDHQADVIQENHYYPFGMTLGGLNYVAGLENRYLYQAKEITSDFNLWWYDFHARRFDSQLGRWHAIDPVIQFASPYVGMGNNPVYFTDYTGTVLEWPPKWWPFGRGGCGQRQGPAPDQNNQFSWWSGGSGSWGNNAPLFNPPPNGSYTYFGTGNIPPDSQGGGGQGSCINHWYTNPNWGSDDVESNAPVGPTTAEMITYTYNNIQTVYSGGINPLPSWLNWTNNGFNAAAYGIYEVNGSIRFMKSGSISLKWYENAWRGNQYAKTFNLSKLGKGVGYGTSFIGAGIGVTNFIISDKSWGDYGQLGVSLISASLTCFPATTPVGIGLGVIDAAGGLSDFYKYLDSNQQLYNNSGLILVPNYLGIPILLNLKR
ncbi:MAG: hypothetical protein M0Q51_13685 [Bacteroidales bacterium]|nr:hypothetical protein [Bacteroidales bacterium]